MYVCVEYALPTSTAIVTAHLLCMSEDEQAAVGPRVCLLCRDTALPSVQTSLHGQEIAPGKAAFFTFAARYSHVHVATHIHYIIHASLACFAKIMQFMLQPSCLLSCSSNPSDWNIACHSLSVRHAPPGQCVKISSANSPACNRHHRHVHSSFTSVSLELCMSSCCVCQHNVCVCHHIMQHVCMSSCFVCKRNTCGRHSLAPYRHNKQQNYPHNSQGAHSHSYQTFHVQAQGTTAQPLRLVYTTTSK